MQAHMLKRSRLERGWTETEAARRLGVSQSYLAMLESGARRVTARLGRKFKDVYKLSPTTLPTAELFEPRSEVTGQVFAREVSALGYPGFAYLKSRSRVRNPAEVLLEGLSRDDLEARLVEALPWLVLQYWDMNASWLVKQAKLNDIQNRLGFVVSLARRVSEKSQPRSEHREEALARLEKMLEESRLVREDTFLKKLNTDVEREWLKQNRSKEAKHWNLLTSWRPEHLQYAV